MQTGYPPEWTEEDISMHIKMHTLYKTNEKLIISRAPYFEDGTPIDPPLLQRQNGNYVESKEDEKDKEECKTPTQSFRKDN